MTHVLVKFFEDDDGEIIEDPVWHLVSLIPDHALRSLCFGEVFGEGESRVVFETKTVKRGVPCPRCKAIVKSFKAIRL